MPWFTDPTWHADVYLLLHWQVEEFNSDVGVVDPVGSGGQHSCHFPRWRHRVVIVAFHLECCEVHGDQTFSCFLASVVVQLLCTDELLPDSLTLKNLVGDMPKTIRFLLCIPSFGNIAIEDREEWTEEVHCSRCYDDVGEASEIQWKKVMEQRKGEEEEEEEEERAGGRRREVTVDTVLRTRERMHKDCGTRKSCRTTSTLAEMTFYVFF